MLHVFLTDKRAELVDLCKSKVALRRSTRDGGETQGLDLESGIPTFLDQLITTLEAEQTPDLIRSREVSGRSDGRPARSEIGTTASRHGRELLESGYTVEQVVHDYGDLCQAVTELALTHCEPITVEEFQTLNRCLDNGIADAVREFGFQRDLLFYDSGVQSANERLGFLAHELRNFIHTASLATAAMKTGFVGLAGATGGVLDRSLHGMSVLIDRALADVRVTAGMPARHAVISLSDFIAEVGVSAALEAKARNCVLAIAKVDPGLGIEADRDLLFSAVGNLLQNAFKFTRPGTGVSLNAHARADRILIEIADQGEGLPPGEAEKMFEPFTQGGTNKSGLGLGLAIARRSVEANNGKLSVRSLPGSGCIFTIDLPRHALPAIATAPVAQSIQ